MSDTGRSRARWVPKKPSIQKGDEVKHDEPPYEGEKSESPVINWKRRSEVNPPTVDNEDKQLFWEDEDDLLNVEEQVSNNDRSYIILTHT